MNTELTELTILLRVYSWKHITLENIARAIHIYREQEHRAVIVFTECHLPRCLSVYTLLCQYSIVCELTCLASVCQCSVQDDVDLKCSYRFFTRTCSIHMHSTWPLLVSTWRSPLDNLQLADVR